MLPIDSYECKIETEGEQNEFEPLDNFSEDVHDVVRWLYSAKVLKIDDDNVISQEELRYQVTSDKVTWVDGTWKCQVSVFDMRDQCLKTFCLQLAQCK